VPVTEQFSLLNSDTVVEENRKVKQFLFGSWHSGVWGDIRKGYGRVNIVEII
jgi:hypothetical protein